MVDGLGGLGNNGVFSLLRQLNEQRSSLLTSFRNLSTGIRSDSSSKLIQSGIFDSQIQSLQTSIETTQRSINFVNTGEASLGQAQDLLQELRSLTISAQDPTLSDDQKNVLQGQADQLLNQLNRLQGASKFGDSFIFSNPFLTSNISEEITNIDITQFSGNFPQTFTFQVSQAATEAQAEGTIAAVQSDDVTFEITGPKGSATIEVNAGATRADVVAQINSFSDQTGVEATDSGEIRTEEVGSNQNVNIQFTDGNLEGITAGVSTGTDVVATFDGVQAQGQGNTAAVTTPGFSGKITFEEGETGTFSFRVNGGGFAAQIGVTPGSTVRFQFPQIAGLGETANLGSVFSLRGNIVNNPNAVKVIDAAISEVSSSRAQLGGLSGNLLAANEDNLNQFLISLTGARSSIRDVNIAQEATDLIRLQTFNRATLSLLGRAQQSESFILDLLA